MKRNGFVFVETIVAVAVLTSSLLLLYTSFNGILQSEKTRVYYDDVSYIYRTYYLKERFDALNIISVLRDITSNEKKYFVPLGVEYQDLFNNHDEDRLFMNNMLDDFEVSSMVVIKENKLDNLKKCTEECSLNSDCEEYENCNSLYMNLSDSMISYIKSMYIDISCTYVLVVEYNTCDAMTNCKNYYSWVSV